MINISLSVNVENISLSFFIFFSIFGSYIESESKIYVKRLLNYILYCNKDKI